MHFQEAGKLIIARIKQKLKKPCWKARLHRISNLNAMNPL